MYYINNAGNTDPHINLALEEYAVRYLDKRKSYVLLYINSPSVILGKHQNIPEEIWLREAHRLNIPVIRRISGGGTVYHDEGNLNFSYITRYSIKNFNQYSKFLNPIIKVIGTFGVNIKKDGRNNLRIDGKKISGNAQFTSRGRILSHGTLLFRSDLNKLHGLIRQKQSEQISSKGSKSIRSTVVNLSDYLPYPFGINDLKQAILDRIFSGEVNEFKLSFSDWEKIKALANEKYNSFEWNYGMSPKSSITIPVNSGKSIGVLFLSVEHGYITGLKFLDDSIDKNDFEALRQVIIGCRFTHKDLLTMSQELSRSEVPSDIVKSIQQMLTHL